ncbi:MAG: hypothetical protein A2W19_08550 [Spirochaetes bacterium RBG_16_49_21]|nr:MAG: hypothetical protein A2W19_08550 [Spirochaetes bacterium RBG_16_49_21]
MKKITDVKDLKRGASINFEHEGKSYILVKTNNGRIVAYNSVCPHEGGEIVWDGALNKLLCECHLSIFNVDDGSVYKFSSVFDKMDNLTGLKLKIDDNQDIFLI